MSDMAEDRVYDADGETTAVYVAAEMGIVRVDASDGRVGGFGIERRCSPTDIAGGGGTIAVATDEDVLVRAGEETADEPAGFESTGFGSAVAVGFDGRRLLAADAEGRISVHGGGDDWRELGAVPADVRAIDGDLVAAADGAYRIDDGIEHVGLEDANDVAVVDGPLVASADGLYELGNGWLSVLDGDVRVVARHPDGAPSHAATTDAFYECPAPSGGGRATPDSHDEWTPVSLPVEERVVGVAYGACPYAVTEAGTLLSGEEEGWRSHVVGVSDVVDVAVADQYTVGQRP